MSNQETKLSLKPFLSKIFLWLPLTFITWFFCAPAIIYLATLLANIVLPLVVGYAVESVEQQGLFLDVVTHFSIRGQGANSARAGQLIFTVNAMKYGYGVPLLLTMVLATPARVSQKLFKFFLGFLILLLTQLWGVCFEILKVLIFSLGPEITAQMQVTSVMREIIIVCYQFGFLVLPSVSPLIIWLVLYQEFVKKLAVKV